MIVCICNNVSERQLKCTVEKHSCDCLSDVKKRIRVCDTCKVCKDHIEILIDEIKENK